MGVFTSTPEGRFLTANPAMAKMFGYDTPQEMIDSITDIASEFYAESSDRNKILQLLEVHQQVENFECRLIRRDGSWLWSSIDVLAMRDESGSITHYHGFITDITEHKQAQDQIEKKSEELELYFNSSLDLLCIANVDGRFLRLNPEWEKVLGYTTQELEGRMFLDFVHPDDVESTVAAVSRLENQEQVLNYVNRFCCKDGSYRWIEWRSRPLGRQIYAAARDITEHKKVLAKLQESEQSLARTLQAIGDGVISTDMDSRVVQMNPVAEKLCGWDEAEARGRLLSDVLRIVNADTRAVVDNPLQKVFATGHTLGLASHVMLLSRTGEEYHIADSAAPIRDSHGNITGAVLVFRDVTREHAQAERLRTSEERLDRAMAVKNEGIWDWNLVTNETYFDDRYYTMAGYSPNEFPQHFSGWAERVHPEDLQKATSAIEDCIAGKTETFDIEFRFKHKDGSWIWIQGQGKIMERNPDDSPLRMIGTHTDITERKLAEEALLESEEMQRKILQAVPDLIVRTDLEGIITFVNELAYPGLSYIPQASIYGRSLFSFIDARDLPRAQENALKRLEKNIGPQEYRLNFEEGISIDTEINGAVVYDKESMPVGMVYVIRDITDRKRDKKELLKAKEQAEAANQAKSRFLANMSHELRTPFNGIMGMMQLLQTTTLDEEQQEYVDMAIKSSQRFARLLSDILDLSSVETGRMSIFNSEFDLGEALGSIHDIFDASAREKGVFLEYLPGDDVPAKVIGDAVRVKQILITLVSNALKFTEKGVVEIRLDALCAAKGGDVRIKFAVSDTGIGIPEDQLKNLFTPFEQLDGSYTRKHQGAGLGLSIVKRLVELMNGNIDIDSLPGEGTTVHVVLPFGLSARDDRETPGKALSTEQSRDFLNILLAEDEPLNQKFMVTLLKKFGHNVVLAPNGKQAVEEFFRHDFDCVLMDIQMPEMTGLEATRAIREAKSAGSKRDVPIIAVTAHTQSGDRERFLDAGMDDYIGKPVSSQDFQRVFDKFFGVKQVQA
ncbi:PAS domain S-box protein [Desulfonatronospira thiodismutans]|nr:PAS domain S-box protein [Desulfonatronospira thiodismutans]